MHSPAFTIKAVGVYLVASGAVILIAPNLILATMGVPPATEIWIRVIGAISIVLGYYYWACGVAGAVAFFRATVPGRVMFAAMWMALIAVFNAPPQLILFSLVDLGGAAWTWMAMRRTIEVPA